MSGQAAPTTVCPDDFEPARKLTPKCVPGLSPAGSAAATVRRPDRGANG
jgi:hypothetical protein